MTVAANTTANIHQTIQSSLAALGLALSLTLVTLLSLDHLATEQHAGTVLARTAAAQQAQASAAGSGARS